MVSKSSLASISPRPLKRLIWMPFLPTSLTPVKNFRDRKQRRDGRLVAFALDQFKQRLVLRGVMVHGQALSCASLPSNSAMALLSVQIRQSSPRRRRRRSFRLVGFLGDVSVSPSNRFRSDSPSLNFSHFLLGRENNGPSRRCLAHLDQVTAATCRSWLRVLDVIAKIAAVPADGRRVVCRAIRAASRISFKLLRR